MRSRVLTVPIAATATLAALLAPTQALAAGDSPAPVTALELSSRDGVVFVDWLSSPDTADADVCFAPGSPPASPDDAGPTCSGPMSASGFSFPGSPGEQYGVSVFAVASGQYGAPASGTVVAVDDPPPPPEGLRTQSLDVREVTAYWDEPADTDDVVDYVVDWAQGMGVPAVDASDGHVTSDPFFTVKHLVADEVYTFAVHARDKGGHIGPAALIRAATRRAGLYVATDDSAHGLEAVNMVGFDAEAAAVTMLPNTRLHSLFTWTNAALDYRGRQPGASFGLTRFVGKVHPGRIALATTARGHAFAVWPTDAGPLYRLGKPKSWPRAHPVTNDGADRVLGVTYDGRRAHVLLMHRQSGHRALWFYTLAGGSWHRSRIAGTNGHDLGALARDMTTGDVVVVDRHRTARGSVVRVAVVPGSATAVSAFRTWAAPADSAVDLRPTNVAVAAGRITVGLQHRTDGVDDGVYLLRGSSHGHGHPVRIGGSDTQDAQVVVTALQPDHVVLSWRRTSTTWSRDDVGVWASQSVRQRSGRWTFTAPKRWTTSAYDMPLAAFRSTTGHVYVAYRAGRGDVTE